MWAGLKIVPVTGRIKLSQMGLILEAFEAVELDSLKVNGHP
jgi:hypothetical protein